MIKYTPQYSHCLATFWGPTLSQGTGICCFQRILGESKRLKINGKVNAEHNSPDNNFAENKAKAVENKTLDGKIELTSRNNNLSNRFVDNFQIAATGEIKEINDNFKIVKKLKLVGEAFKVNLKKNKLLVKV